MMTVFQIGLTYVGVFLLGILVGCSDIFKETL